MNVLLCIANISAGVVCLTLHDVFSVCPLQRWVFSLRLSSLATEHQSASRFTVCGDYRVGRDEHVAEPGELPHLSDRVSACLNVLHVIG